MTTDASPNKKKDSEQYSESIQDFDNIAMTPVRKSMVRDEDMSALDGSEMPLKTPTDRAETNPPAMDGSEMPWETPTETNATGGSSMPFQTPDDHVGLNRMPAENEDSLLFPPPNLVNAALETPILSNVRRRSTDIGIRPGIMGGRRRSSLSKRSDGVDFDRSFLKSVSFGKTNIDNSEREIVFDEADDEYGQFYIGSADGSPNRKGRLPETMEETIGGLINLQKGEEEHDTLSIPELAITKQRISFKTKPGHRRFNSNISEISLESDSDAFEDPIPGMQDNDNRRIVQNSNRRLSLTVDLETGRSPNRSSQNFLHGQKAMRRVYSSEMLEAQSPRIRRRRAMSQNLEQLRKGLSKRLSMPSPKSLTDLQKFADSDDGSESDDPEALEQSHPVDIDSLSDHSRESVRMADRKRRRRYTVEQVQLPSEKQLEKGFSFKNVQYRLSAITPIELRRRRYRNSIRQSISGPASTDFNLEAPEKGVRNDGMKDHTEGACAGCLTAFCNVIVEILIFVWSKTRENYSVGVVNKVLFWTFRKNFFIVLLSAAFSFYVFTVLFATCIYLIGRRAPQCIHVNGLEFDHQNVTKFVDAFALSWTTFSTVGYGLVYPGTTSTMENSSFWTCSGMSLVTTFEAFFGILFSGFWGAIWFAKVTRVSSFAQVSFSDAIVVKYGTGVTGVVENEEYEDASSEEEAAAKLPSGDLYKQSKLPCPIFEFRIANRLHRQKGGEIIDACINIVASMEESQSTRTVRNGAGMEPMIRRKGRRPKRSSSKKKLRPQSNRSLGTYAEEETNKEINIQQAQTAAIKMIASYIDDENKGGKKRKSRPTTSKVFPNQIFAKLNVESMEHPFFKRVWNIRHALDESSPLLKPEAKELIRINHGHWPEELNNATAVRASIQFNQILVSFSGTSNVDANSVYSQNAYDFEDMCVGYAFCNMLFREANGSIGVDHTLLNDVKEQSGGGGEELHFRDHETSTRSLGDIFIL